jgi:putative glycosyltransferase (TIGR04372 family)
MSPDGAIVKKGDASHPIVMLLKCRAVGEILVRNLFLCALSRHYPESVVYAVINPDSADEAQAVLLNPYIDYVVLADRVSDDFLSTLRSWSGDDDEWTVKRRQLTSPFLWVPPNVIYVMPEVLLGRPKETTRARWPDLIWRDAIDNTLFRIPPAVAEDCAKTLVELGLDAARWFVTLHIREDGYQRTGRHPRSVHNLDPYVELIRYIHVRGGQVVRMGDPRGTALPAMPGFVDVSRRPNSLLLQAYACSRSRFFIGGDSGPSTVAVGFNTPTALVNVISGSWYGVAPKNHIVATKKFQLDDGRIVRDAEAVACGALGETQWLPHMDRLHELPAEDLCHITDLMLERTAGASGWVHREPGPPPLRKGPADLDDADLARRQSWRISFYSDIAGTVS